mmetsp:Transcript_41996/g.47844  ORF Transcript_41996/g.47844 Transcript_41996/m.47844 type:complete len:90 (-) Transcript_41996:7-276(-)
MNTPTNVPTNDVGYSTSTHTFHYLTRLATSTDIPDSAFVGLGVTILAPSSSIQYCTTTSTVFTHIFGWASVSIRYAWNKGTLFLYITEV